MTEAALPVSLSPQARALAARCEGQVNELARRITREDFAVFPGYEGLPDDMKHTEMAATVRYGLRLFFTLVREGRAGRDEEFRFFQERAAQRAEEGWPLHLLLRTHLLSRHALFRVLRAAAEPGEEAALAELADLLLGGSAELIGALAETYQLEQSALLAERREQRRTLARALLAGFPVLPGRLEEAGLQHGSLVLAFAVSTPTAHGTPAPAPAPGRAAPGPDRAAQASVPAGTRAAPGPDRAAQASVPAGTRAAPGPGRAAQASVPAGTRAAPGPGRATAAAAAESLTPAPALAPTLAPAVGGGEAPSVALGRRLRRVQGVLERAFGAEVLVVAEAEGGHALVPAEALGPRGPEAGRVPDMLAARLARVCEADVWVAATEARDGPGIAAAGRTAGEVLRLARALGRRPGVYRLDDVLLEFHLSRAGEASAPLAALLDPLADRPELLATLRSYLAHQQDRRATARELGLHPNTVDNRLTRAGELVGIDVTAPRGYALALTALTLRDLRGPL
ncbi:hypothetical protein ABH931_006346 [Streptacidiphilus sp. MAP12-33]|uniref:helix-turn-helix domain-containing protein n=1 Tax=Streptacidiphilus sp. MAP12-33 TaxID=3156266 RepID=UPI003518017A